MRYIRLLFARFLSVRSREQQLELPLWTKRR
jgi:hypothetical protein